MEKDKKLVIIFNYHRIGSVDPDNPFHKLHTVDSKVFIRQVNLMARLGKIVSMDEIREFTHLSRLNFAITFDDVSYSLLGIRQFLKSKLIPYTICPCTTITNNGLGVRDKVYCIIQHYSRQELLDYTKKVLANRYPLDEKNFSFYHFTKSDSVAPAVIEKEVITPLFDNIPNVSEIMDQEKAYLDWDDIKNNFIDDPRVTVANHSEQHMNMATIPREDVFADVHNSTEQCERNLGVRPSYYAVPFGHITQSLAYDLNESLRGKNYKGVLWVDGGVNLLKGPYQSQMIHLSRIHTPVTYRGFLKSLIFSFRGIHQLIIDRVKKGYDPEMQTPKDCKVVESEDPVPALSFENLVRQGKDYASDINFFKYSFTENPYKVKRPDYYTLCIDDRIESIAYNFHIRFSLWRKPVDGIYFAGWRKLPNAKSFGSTLLLKALKREAIIGIYKPSEIIGSIFESNMWKRILVNKYRIKTQKIKSNNSSDSLIEVKQYDMCPDSIRSISNVANQKYFFSIFRSQEFYQWRYNLYPLAKPVYFVSFINNTSNGYFVCLYKESVLCISDFFCLSMEAFRMLWFYTINYCKYKGISSIQIETSLPDVSQWIEHTFECDSSSFSNYYYFNTKLFDIDENWGSAVFHETQASGDVLLK